MALDASRLKTAEKAKIKTKLASLFSSTGLTASEVTAFDAAQDDIAEAMSEGALETVPEITGNAVVTTITSTPGATAGGSVLPGTGGGGVT